MRKQNEDKIKKKATSVDDELSERLKKLNDPKNKQGNQKKLFEILRNF